MSPHFIKSLFSIFLFASNLQKVSRQKSAESQPVKFRPASGKKERETMQKKNTPPPPIKKTLREFTSPYPDIFLKFDFGLLTQDFCRTMV